VTEVRLKPQAIEGGGEMGARIRAHDWGATPLGRIESWPQSLRSALGICLHSSVPTALCWGPELRLLYNDAWASVSGPRHPALGRRAAEVWADTWHVVGPQIERVRETGEGFAAYDQMLPMRRHGGAVEETYWNYSLTGVRGEDGRIAGVLNQGSETTARVLGERRLQFVLDLSDRLRGLADPEAVKAEAVRALGEHLGVARAGYGEIDEAQETVAVRGDWTGERGVRSLAGEAQLLDAFGPAVIDELRAGRTLIVEDCLSDPRSGAHAAAWASIGTRSLVVVPLTKDGRLRSVLYLHEPEPRRWTEAETALARDVAERTWEAAERALAETALRESEERFRQLTGGIREVFYVGDVARGRLLYVSPAFEEIWQRPSDPLYVDLAILAESVHPEDRERVRAAFARQGRGEETDTEYRIVLPDGGLKWVRDRGFPLLDGAGQVHRVAGFAEDITERKRAEEHQRLLVNELNHRVKNSLAIVQAVAGQTLRNATSLEQAREAFTARLRALARAHDVLTRENWEGADLGQVVADAVFAHADETGPRRFSVGGPPVRVSPKTALSLALAIHELATNAAKYGALSSEAGEVAVAWDIAEGEPRRLRLTWEERGGPPVAPPARRGFGSRLIEEGLASELRGSVVMEYRPAGVLCTVDAPLAARL